MTQKEKLYYYLDKINNNTTLKDEIYWKCGLCIHKPEELQYELEALMEGGCKQTYELVPFANDGSGGVCVLVDNQYVAMIDSEGGAGYIAASVDDFINILLWYKYIPITKKLFDGFEEFIEDYQRDEYSQNTSEIINEFLQSEHLDLDNRMVYEKFLKGVSLVPVFIIEPTDEEYEISENLFRFDEEEFYDTLRLSMRKEVKMWGEFVFNEPYEGQDIYQINEIDLPISYIEFMKRHNGGEGDIGNTWFRLYRLEELQELNDNLEIDKYLPKHIIIGGCDGELYGINADGYYFNVPEIIEEEYLTLLGNDIEQLPVQVNKLWD